jgi:hypothetical protein
MRIVLMMVDGESPFVSGMNVMMMFVCTTMQYEANDIPMPCHAAAAVTILLSFLTVRWN